MDKEELRLEILRIVVENGSENQKSNPLPICEEYYKWISKANENSPKKSKTMRKTSSTHLTDNKE
ncbi:hypothetical protein [uncultured phage MedDCM-OCT-S04-C1161]|uniref:Uncharacterized protein n=2 Tax=environmental samples TaxID=151659 RepID=D6PL58_9ZZZZ|nr:hypothetical protein [uncultured phage MedDCM-OCT-S04-C1161]ADD94171.1 hypothetical protein [uncultured phage MedDCM-OCT-S04-C1201]ADD94309.1 hypothetical protein [uncultured phage MedDCM-OCT-S04-C695]ADD94362.1 hypothetical protein [uncultured phage MedDCM-OCT-S04-C890]ADD95997.1 hypothetical protein [uncultured organism MedDCM-OCT-S04-C1073]ADD96459.1 hypothetical protein [uncultured organism MedDCM-OCT-S09-C787]